MPGNSLVIKVGGYTVTIDPDAPKKAKGKKSRNASRSGKVRRGKLSEVKAVSGSIARGVAAVGDAIDSIKKIIE